jgi:general stress protein YciG
MMAKKDRTSKRGFASMDREKQREIASQGGVSVPRHARSFSRDPELAVSAGRKGGQESGGNFKNDPTRAAEAGRKSRRAVAHSRKPTA